MSMINHTHGFIFLHVAKTGGRSINMLLKQQLGDEGIFNTKKINSDVNRLGRMLGLEAQQLAGVDTWDDLFTFAFVRNPWDRAVSIYEHMWTDYQATRFPKRGKTTEKARLLLAICEALDTPPKSLTFEHFVYGVLRDRAFENYHWDVQSNALTDGKGKLLFDFVGRFEQLQTDFDHACQEIGLPRLPLPHHNRSKRQAWPSYYSAETLKLVADIYRQDIELFNYQADASTL